ncbi:zinc finger CW-type PWWP domain protein 1-like isoform X10 [Tachysurus fulvidraco]|uniref:zinc finger CW-type PWWP domain protein 1-like isoform X10 n=1 Tax=Tachysurus fulvidraco TaxID=1234273 RepID=UPI001FEDF1B4|nr:zinc finger CW-type PWWP domain protein 1-like isoform X10 [Tachysurus fulvidraco]
MMHTDERHYKKKQMIDGGKDDELKSVTNVMYLRATKLRKRRSGEMEGASEKNRSENQKERKWRPKKRGKDKGTDESGDEGTSGEKTARKGWEDEKRQKVKGRRIIKKSRDSKQQFGLVRTLITHRETDRKKCQEEKDQRDETSDGDQHSTFSSCSAPEEKSSAPEEETFFYSLVPGSLVWAQQSGYSWWPALVERDPNTEQYLEFCSETDLTPYKCHVTYFGEPVTRAWVSCNKVRDYADHPEDNLLHVQKRLKDSICMAKEALHLSLKERLVKFGFRMRYVSDRESSEDSDIAADQTVPRGAMKTSTDMTFDRDSHSDGEL